MQAGNGATPLGTNDPFYPGGNVASGGAPGFAGGAGAVVILAYPSSGTAPTINSPLAQSWGVGQTTSYQITATNNPAFYSATGLPPGLNLDQAGGSITGGPTTTGTYNSTINAINPYGTGSATLVWTIVATDSTAPSVPSGLLASSTTLTSFILSWTASTDNAAVYCYEVKRDGVSQGTVSTTSFSATGLQSGQTYAFAVRARDTAGNWSAWSSAFSIALADTTAPTTPTALNYADKTATTVTLIWKASTDDVGVVGYAVYRGGTLVGSTGDTVFTDSGLTASTAYSYTVKAFDAAGNYSAATSALSVTTTADFSADSDHDGIPDVVETALGTNGGSAANADTTNQTQQNIHRPKP
jgi:chitodextrinase